MKFITLLIVCVLTANTSLAKAKIEPYPPETCQEIYRAIGTFLVLADTQWKQQNTELAMLYSTASANYATIYATVCKE
ncbi:MAG: hypothetical protein QF872_03550 [Gammaproteobacteria bacterium]|jgi:hypothetical protein|nr:hypothetical protein [Gammaproteobacteria bacterium]